MKLKVHPKAANQCFTIKFDIFAHTWLDCSRTFFQNADWEKRKKFHQLELRLRCRIGIHGNVRNTRRPIQRLSALVPAASGFRVLSYLLQKSKRELGDVWQRGECQVCARASFSFLLNPAVATRDNAFRCVCAHVAEWPAMKSRTRVVWGGVCEIVFDSNTLWFNSTLKL